MAAQKLPCQRVLNEGYVNWRSSQTKSKQQYCHNLGHNLTRTELIVKSF